MLETTETEQPVSSGRDAALPRAIRLLGHLWLSEIGGDDVDPILDLPMLGPALGSAIAGRGGDVDAAIVDLAAEHLRLFGIEMPPYESVFVDPSGMLGAPASERVASRLERVGWSAPKGARVAAPDHVGLEFLALGDLLEAGADAAAAGLVRDHLALWVPPMVMALHGLEPHPVYRALGELTLQVVMSQLEEKGPQARSVDPFPDLPPAPEYRGDHLDDGAEDTMARPDVRGASNGDQRDPAEKDTSGSDRSGHRAMAKFLVIPRKSGLFLSRPMIRAVAKASGLPVSAGAGDRTMILADLFRSATTYDAQSALETALHASLDAAAAGYAELAAETPAWAPYSRAWRERIETTIAQMGATS